MKWEDIFKKYDFNPFIKEKYEPVLKRNNQRHRLMQFILLPIIGILLITIVILYFCKMNIWILFGIMIFLTVLYSILENILFNQRMKIYQQIRKDQLNREE